MFTNVTNVARKKAPHIFHVFLTMITNYSYLPPKNAKQFCFPHLISSARKNLILLSLRKKLWKFHIFQKDAL